MVMPAVVVVDLLLQQEMLLIPQLQRLLSLGVEVEQVHNKAYQA
jgi:hypothetical protein